MILQTNNNETAKLFAKAGALADSIRKRCRRHRPDWKGVIVTRRGRHLAWCKRCLAGYDPTHQREDQKGPSAATLAKAFQRAEGEAA